LPLWTSLRAVAMEILKVAAASAKLTRRRLTGWDRSGGADLVPGDRGSMPSPAFIVSLGTGAAVRLIWGDPEQREGAGDCFGRVRG
jgi:hypothetical protein